MKFLFLLHCRRARPAHQTWQNTLKNGAEMMLPGNLFTSNKTIGTALAGFFPNPYQCFVTALYFKLNEGPMIEMYFYTALTSRQLQQVAPGCNAVSAGIPGTVAVSLLSVFSW